MALEARGRDVKRARERFVCLFVCFVLFSFVLFLFLFLFLFFGLGSVPKNNNNNNGNHKNNK